MPAASLGFCRYGKARHQPGLRADGHRWLRAQVTSPSSLQRPQRLPWARRWPCPTPSLASDTTPPAGSPSGFALHPDKRAARRHHGPQRGWQARMRPAPSLASATACRGLHGGERGQAEDGQRARGRRASTRRPDARDDENDQENVSEELRARVFPDQKPWQRRSLGA